MQPHLVKKKKKSKRMSVPQSLNTTTAAATSEVNTKLPTSGNADRLPSSPVHQISRSLQNLKHGDTESTSGKRAGSADTVTHREREAGARKPAKHRRCHSQSVVMSAAQHGLAAPTPPHSYARSYSATEQVLTYTVEADFFPLLFLFN